MIQKFKAIVTMLLDLWRNRQLILRLSINDFKTRYAGSMMGIFWAFVQPVITVLVYWFVFEKGLRAGSQAMGGVQVPFVLFLISGLVPWFYFSDAWTNGTSSLMSYSYLVKKVVFKVELLPVIKLISCFMVHLCFLVIMFGLYLLDGRKPMISWLQVFYYAFALSMLSLGIILLTGAVQIFFKDMAQIVGICLQFGMWLTPIMYDEHIFTSRAAWLETFFKLNPFYYIAAGYRDSMLTGDWFFMRPTMTVYFWAVTFALLVLGLRVFRKLRPHFSDVL